jgi:hypothetical protein
MAFDGLEVRQRDAMEVHQVGMAAFIKRVPRCAVWAEMGSGKTASALTAVLDCYHAFDTYRMLVIGPLRVAQKGWSDEIAAWAHLAALRYAFLEGSEASLQRKIDRLLPDTEIMGVSCDSVHTLAKIYLGRRPPWDWIIVDEASKFKNESSRRGKALRLLTIHPTRVTELTGTPMPNGYPDLFNQIYCLDRGQRLGRTMKQFKEMFFRTAAGTVGKKLDKTGEIRVMKALEDIVYILRPEDYKSEKHPRINPIKLDLTAELKQQYKDFERKYVLKLLEGGKITAVNEAALQRKLLQFSSGAIYDENKVAQLIHSIKLDELREIVEDNEGKPLLIAYNFKHEVDRIMAAFPQAEQFGSDPEQIDRWNRGEIPMLLAHPRSAGHGLNLQFGGHILIWYSFDYNLEEHQQMNKRLPRPGQKHQVILHYLIMRETLDESVLSSLNVKDNVQSSFQNRFREHLASIIAELGFVSKNDGTYRRAV